MFFLALSRLAGRVGCALIPYHLKFCKVGIYSDRVCDCGTGSVDTLYHVNFERNYFSELRNRLSLPLHLKSFGDIISVITR